MAELAARQNGIATTAQLLALGLTPAQVGWRVSVGWLHRLHQGVYAVGFRPTTRQGWWTAAVLAGGSGAALTHRSAAALWGLRSVEPREIEVLTARPGARPRAGLRLHRTRALAPADVSIRDGIRVTSPARTLLDLAGVLPARELPVALERARVQRLVTEAALDDVLARAVGRPGRRALARALDAPFTRSELERRLLALVGAHGLPRPRTNVLCAGLEVDAVWPHRRLVVELDGAASHATRAAHRRDEACDARLRQDGWRVVRLTWWDVTRDAARTAARLRAALASANA